METPQQQPLHATLSSLSLEHDKGEAEAWLDRVKGRRCLVELVDGDGVAWHTELQIAGPRADPLLREVLVEARSCGRLNRTHSEPDSSAFRRGPPVFHSPSHLDMKSESLSGYLTQEERDNILQRDRLLKVRKITGLDCGGDPLFVIQLLDRVSPHIEELDVSNNTSPELARMVSSMPKLRVLKAYWCIGERLLDSLPVPFPQSLEELELEFPTREALLALQQLPRLRSLFLGILDEYDIDDDIEGVKNDVVNVTFPPLPADYCGLRRLGVYMLKENKPTVLSLLGAHSATLEEVWFFCDSSAPFERCHVHPLVGDADWARLSMRALRLVVLGRCEVHGKNCSRQKDEVRAALQRTLPDGRKEPVDVLCEWCDQRDRRLIKSPFNRRYAPDDDDDEFDSEGEDDEDEEGGEGEGSEAKKLAA